MQNKKAQVEDWLPLMLIIVVLFFFVSCTAIGNLSRHKTIDSAVTSRLIVKDSSQQLLNYLKSPVKLDNMNDVNVADALNYYYLNKNDKLLSQIKAATDEFFSKSSIETDYASYSIEIAYPNKDIVIEPEKLRKQKLIINQMKKENDLSKIKISERKEMDAAIIPIFNTDKIIQIKLFMITTK